MKKKNKFMLSFIVVFFCISIGYATLNKELPAYSKIAGVKMQSEEFEKTPKRSIKRFLYQH